jgi:FMN phosphatase YigB (HAD superfamily)
LITTLLIDLDDTLLGNHINAFLPVYLERLGAFTNDLVPAAELIPTLLEATQRMMQNRDPGRTLEQAFAEAFFPRLSASREDLERRFASFYATEFPQLRSLTRERPESRQLVETAQRLGLELTVGTNPLFPRTAIEQRLAWAGVPVQEIGYAFVPSFETMHFCKPDPAYFTEILGRLGRAPEQAGMIGDNPDDDLAPARSLGMAVFQVTEPAGQYLRQAQEWVPRAHEQVDPQAAREAVAILALLRGHLAAFLGLTADLSSERAAARPEPDSWAPVEIVAHVADVEAEVNTPRLSRVLDETNPFLSAADTDRWADDRGYRQRSMQAARASLRAARMGALTQLESLERADWDRPARHALLGPTSLRELMSVVVEHDRLHLAQLRAALSA